MDWPFHSASHLECSQQSGAPAFAGVTALKATRPDVWRDALIRPSGTFSHPADGRREWGRKSPFSRWQGQWEKVADRPDEGPSRRAAKGKAGAGVVDGDEAHAGHGGQRGANLRLHLAALAEGERNIECGER